MKTPTERLMSRIDVRGEDDCWPWTGAIGTWGYGTFWLNGKNFNSSRAAYLLLVGPITDGSVVCHKCDNPPCCNPRHLWLGTQGDNVRDCSGKGRSRGLFSANCHPRHLAKLTPEKVLDARRRFQSGETQIAIGRALGVHSSVISRAVRGCTWGHIK